MVNLKGYIHGNTVVVEDEKLNSYEGCEVEIRVLEKEPMKYHEACQILRRFEGSGILEGEQSSRRLHRVQIESLVGKGGKTCPNGMDAQDYVNSIRSEYRVF